MWPQGGNTKVVEQTVDSGCGEETCSLGGCYGVSNGMKLVRWKWGLMLKLSPH